MHRREGEEIGHATQIKLGDGGKEMPFQCRGILGDAELFHNTRQARPSSLPASKNPAKKKGSSLKRLLLVVILWETELFRI